MLLYIINLKRIDITFLIKLKTNLYKNSGFNDSIDSNIQ
jgi:hypothetical protein